MEPAKGTPYPNVPPPYGPQHPYPQQPIQMQPNRPVQTGVPVIVVPTNYGPKPQQIVCPNCNATIMTSTETQASTKTHAFAVALCVFQCWLCCWIPYCVDSCQNVNHTCPNCNTYLGAYNN